MYLTKTAISLTILWNADMAGGEFQTGDMGTPPNRAS